MSTPEERLEKTIKAIQDSAHTARQKEAVPLAEQIQRVFFQYCFDRIIGIDLLKEFHKAIWKLDEKITEISNVPPVGDDEKFFINWLYKPQAELFACWSRNVGYVLEDLDQRTNLFSLHVDRQLAHPWTDINKVKFAYEDVLKRAKEIIEDYYAILVFKTYHAITPSQSALRPSKETRKLMIEKIDNLAQNCLERVQNGNKQMRELYFKFSDHRFAGESTKNAKLAAVFALLTLIISAFSLFLGFAQIFSPTTIQTATGHSLEVRGANTILNDP